VKRLDVLGDLDAIGFREQRAPMREGKRAGDGCEWQREEEATDRES
jgi:hypothetical protein